MACALAKLISQRIMVASGNYFSGQNGKLVFPSIHGLQMK
jgi:hypothetical protein